MRWGEVPLEGSTKVDWEDLEKGRAWRSFPFPVPGDRGSPAAGAGRRAVGLERGAARKVLDNPTRAMIGLTTSGRGAPPACKAVGGVPGARVWHPPGLPGRMFSLADLPEGLHGLPAHHRKRGWRWNRIGGVRRGRERMTGEPKNGCGGGRGNCATGDEEREQQVEQPDGAVGHRGPRPSAAVGWRRNGLRSAGSAGQRAGGAGRAGSPWKELCGGVWVASC